jgi:hypothetical protein
VLVEGAGLGGAVFFTGPAECDAVIGQPAAAAVTIPDDESISEIRTAGTWGLFALMALLAGAAFHVLRHR